MSCDSEPLSMRGRIVPVFCVSGCSHIMFSFSLIYTARPGYMKVGGTIAYHILSLSVRQDPGTCTQPGIVMSRAMRKSQGSYS